MSAGTSAVDATTAGFDGSVFMMMRLMSLTIALMVSPVFAQSPQADQHASPPPVIATSAVIVAFTLDTPIEQLIADPKAKAVLDNDLPGLSDDPNLPKFQAKSLRLLQPMTGGQMSDAMLAKTGADLAAIAPLPASVPVPAPVGPVTRKKIDSGR